MDGYFEKSPSESRDAQTQRVGASQGLAMARLVAAGIFLSRIAGLLRESVFAHYFGNSDSADAFKAAFRIPNILQNLFGEGVLSASFIPVYSRLLAQHKEREASELAYAVGLLLGLAMTALAIAGVFAAPYLVDALAPGFQGAKRSLAIALARIFFPGAGLLALSAWCLGVLNSHNRFFASYAAPVAWNSAIILAMVFYGTSRSESSLARIVAWGALIGSALQFGVQLPQALTLLGSVKISLSRARRSLASVFGNFVPVVVGRGVVQLSSYVDNVLASLLPGGAVAALNYAQIINMLPVSLFGMSVAAAELPAMARAAAPSSTAAETIAVRLNFGLRQISFLVTPSAAAFLFLGDVIVGALFQSGRFGRADALYVWVVLAGSAIGLLAVTMGRLYSSAYYALWDTRTPLKFAVLRVLLTALLGYVCALLLPPFLGIDRRWGVVGLTATAGIAGWIEFILLRATLNRRIGTTGVESGFLIKLWALACVAALAALMVKTWVAPSEPHLRALVVLPVYGAVYLGAARWLKIPELTQVIDALRIGRHVRPEA